MKKLVNVFGIYLFFGLVAGVFGREFPKFFDFKGYSALSVLHVHILMLGAFLFLILILFAMNTSLLTQKSFSRFFKIYNIGFPFMAIMLLVRGIVSVTGKDLSKGMDAAISGISGISHIMLAFAFFYLFQAIKSSVSDRKEA